MIRVLVVEDSRFMRGVINTITTSAPGTPPEMWAPKSNPTSRK